MSATCSPWPLGALARPDLYLPYGIALPALIVVGFVGNLVALVTLQTAHLRLQDGLYIYLSGLVTLDILQALLAVVPSLPYLGLLTPQQVLSRPMALYHILHYPIRHILKHSMVWTVVFLAIMRLASTTRNRRRHRWTKISASRLIVFLIVLVCVLTDFPRFFELRLQRIQDHCFGSLEIWSWWRTDFGQPLYNTVYPWLTLATFVAVPFAILTICWLVLAYRLHLCRLLAGHQEVWARTEDEARTSLMILALLTLFFLLEIPESTLMVLQDLRAQAPPYSSLEHGLVATHCMSLGRACCTLVVLCALSRNFRVAFRRLFCCGCVLGDDYIEPLKCPCRCKIEIKPPTAEPEPDLLENGPIWV